MRINTLNISSSPGFRRGLSHLAGSGLQPVGEIQNGLATARQAVLEVLLADRPAGVTIGAAQVVAGAARIVLAIFLPFVASFSVGPKVAASLRISRKLLRSDLEKPSRTRSVTLCTM